MRFKAVVSTSAFHRQFHVLSPRRPILWPLNSSRSGGSRNYCCERPPKKVIISSRLLSTLPLAAPPLATPMAASHLNAIQRPFFGPLSSQLSSHFSPRFHTLRSVPSLPSHGHRFPPLSVSPSPLSFSPLRPSCSLFSSVSSPPIYVTLPPTKPQQQLQQQQLEQLEQRQKRKVWETRTTAANVSATLAADEELEVSSATVVEGEVVGETEGGKEGEAGSGGVQDEDLLIKRVELPTNESSEKLLRIRHTAAHVMAMAVQKLFPEAQCTIGPWIAKGFYYDFDLKEPLTDKDLKKIKKEMDRIIGRNLPLRCEEVSRAEAEERIRSINEPYKLEILEGISEPITIYHIGDEWWDLCAGPHVERTGQLPRRAIELESVAGSYWRGDEKRAALQRIYGTAWETPEQLQAYTEQKEAAKARDHRKLGQELNLFSIQEEAGGGLVFWHPKGAMVRQIMEDYWKQKHLQRGYELLYTPHVAKLDLWKTSGHFDFYKENMFDQMEIEEETYQLKPMNCPCHIMVYKDAMRSYRDLPLRWGELGTVYRYERSGTMHGLFRVRGFTQDDAHIFCLPAQMRSEIRGVLDLTEEILSDFGFTKLEVMLSTRPEKAVGSAEIWDKATTALREALQDKGWEYAVDEGGGAFYGPKIDMKIEDAIGRKWQCSTIQVDFNLPQRFNMVYVESDQSRQQPIMIHRAIFGSLERFFGILIENYAGDFPLWLAPVQARVLPVTNGQLDFAHDVVAELRGLGVRAEVAFGERLAKLIRNAETQKIPVMAVAGAKEMEAKTLTVRTRRGGEIGTLPVAELAARIKTAVDEKGFL
eukprot:TRINITY_DN980_c1_g1_i1.p1 TRINITY_DN980_c1_g1~~TRINITY_DN980_c1_g1_i1.p1  ORF type:complete len:815 (-),score=161.91 TRINITY_DN980_c1_g1_i1:345-2789(-)